LAGVRKCLEKQIFRLDVGDHCTHKLPQLETSSTRNFLNSKLPRLQTSAVWHNPPWLAVHGLNVTKIAVLNQELDRALDAGRLSCIEVFDFQLTSTSLVATLLLKPVSSVICQATTRVPCCSNVPRKVKLCMACWTRACVAFELNSMCNGAP
jgi:hypothetical protein